jgi:hypothetical protein
MKNSVRNEDIRSSQPLKEKRIGTLACEEATTFGYA